MMGPQSAPSTCLRPSTFIARSTSRRSSGWRRCWCRRSCWRGRRQNRRSAMPLRHILGVDHVVVVARDLDAAAAQWRKLGFTLSPRGTHSPQMGSGNYTIMFGEDYLELLGVLHETEQNKPTREFLKNREGIERTAFT